MLGKHLKGFLQIGGDVFQDDERCGLSA